MTKVVEWSQECKACNATGIYVGMAERDGFGVVCHSCKGTGEQQMRFEYEPFQERKKREDVKRVLRINPGICVGGGTGGKFSISDFGGMNYEMWWTGAPFLQGQEMRRLTCPAWWYQSADYKKKPEWEECSWGSFPGCKHFPQKDQCWERFDQEQKA